jgi:hypothetical protein
MYYIVYSGDQITIMLQNISNTTIDIANDVEHDKHVRREYNRIYEKRCYSDNCWPWWIYCIIKIEWLDENDSHNLWLAGVDSRCYPDFRPDPDFDTPSYIMWSLRQPEVPIIKNQMCIQPLLICQSPTNIHDSNDYDIHIVGDTICKLVNRMNTDKEKSSWGEHMKYNVFWDGCSWMEYNYVEQFHWGYTRWNNRNNKSLCMNYPLPPY